jgi:hypothetical protein
VIQGHKGGVLGLVIITCLTNSPDIFFLSYGQNEPLPRYGDVDSHQNVQVKSQDVIRMNFGKYSGKSILQVLKGNEINGFDYCLAEQDAQGNSWITKWKLN